MGLIAAIGSGLSWLFGNSKSAEKSLDAVIKTGDALVFTDEEKSKANQKVLDATIEYMRATQGMSVARRIIAFIVCSLWAFLIVVAVLTGYFDRSVGSFSEYVFTVLRDIVNDPFKIIIGFYFLTAVGSSAIGALKRFKQ